MDQATGGDRAGNDRLDRPLPHGGQHAQHDLAATLDQAEDGRLVLRRRAASRRALQPAPAPEPPLLATAAGWTLWHSDHRSRDRPGAIGLPLQGLTALFIARNAAPTQSHRAFTG